MWLAQSYTAEEPQLEPQLARQASFPSLRFDLVCSQLPASHPITVHHTNLLISCHCSAGNNDIGHYGQWHQWWCMTHVVLRTRMWNQRQRQLKLQQLLPPTSMHLWLSATTSSLWWRRWKRKIWNMGITLRACILATTSIVGGVVML